MLFWNAKENSLLIFSCLIEGEPFAFVTTRGFGDLLKIGNQSRPDLFDLAINSPQVLYQHVIEVDERVTLLGYSSGGQVTLKLSDYDLNDSQTFQGLTGEHVKVLRPLNVDEVKTKLNVIFKTGVKCLAIALMHSYTFPKHELMIADIAKEIGFTHITLSSQISPMIKIVPRGSSSCVDAFLTPCIQRYISGFVSGFDGNLMTNVSVLFMRSDGGLAKVGDFSGFQAILSGPSGGVVGYSKTSYNPKLKTPVIGFDMGGTSTDVSRFGGAFDHVFETRTAGIDIQVPQLDITTVAAGGGSRLFYKFGLLHVGPESAGAHPGPSCYMKNGPLAITDANLVLGRINPIFFPRIFGPNEDSPLDIDASIKNFHILLDQIQKDSDKTTKIPVSVEELAYGFIQVANEAMCRPIREITLARGYDTKNHILACFGGAGGQHACAIAINLGIKRVYIHRFASVLSAFGLSLADVINETQEPTSLFYNDDTRENIRKKFTELENKSSIPLVNQGITRSVIRFEYYLNMRYHGTNCSLMTRSSSADSDFLELFCEDYKREFGFLLHARDVVIDDIRVRAIYSSSNTDAYEDMDFEAKNLVDISDATAITPVYFEGGKVQTPFYRLDLIKPGSQIIGPAILIDTNNTIVIEPKCIAKMSQKNNIVIDVNVDTLKFVNQELDPIQLSIFGHRFMSIAEQMGRTLQRTSVSTNIKERLDFSCALFAADGGLVANAPHIPVHLGSMQDAVRFQVDFYKDSLRNGDVLVSNHPSAGGSHLPDITVITPVFHERKILFFVASRGHHADIGGIAPGSMPPTSKELFEEGAAIKSFKLVENGVFQEKGIIEILLNDPARYPKCSGTRNLDDNLSDLKAQVAANNRGIKLVQDLIEEYSADVVLAYMKYIRENAEQAVRGLLKQICQKYGTDLEACDFMDDGSKICLKIFIDSHSGSAKFDFSGTSPQVYANLNAPKSITFSAVIYCLRCLVGQSIPLNEGCLVPAEIFIPAGCILNPEEGLAVVGGNVLTSQRVVDVILKAFRACAASQGCMNNLTFGMPPDSAIGRLGWGYYETIAGGSGAGPTWHGTDGVHTHMTNTRITDPEILERRYPAILRQFGIRHNSGGDGKFKGGNGIVREMEFLEPMEVSILSERRVFKPYGLEGGGDGMNGLNLIYLADGKSCVNLGGKNSICVEPGDRLQILTPGGGGYGTL